MALTDISHPTDIAMLTDLYELTMAQGLWESGKANEQGCFTAFYRDHPFGSAYAVMCGTAELPELVENLRFTPEDIDYLASLQAPAGGAMFKSAFLDYLRDFRAHVNIDAVPEGELVFPREPMVRVTGPALECQLLETALLNIVGFQTLVATKTARVVLAADGRPVAEFGLRRAQGPDGGLAVARASYVAGCSSTSNVLAGRRYGIPVFGTHAHSWVMSFDSELEAFRAFAKSSPKNCTLLIDTYDVREGCEHAITVAKEMEAVGERLSAIRIDSGDLAKLSKYVRGRFDAEGLPYVGISVSNDLDEYTIQSLLDQGAPIDSFGVGTKLATCYDQPALGGVYKLSARRASETASYVYIIAAVFVPPFVPLAPLAFYDIARRVRREHAWVALGIGSVFAFALIADLRTDALTARTLLLTAILSVAATLLSLRTAQLEHEQQRMRRTRDELQERALALEARNRDLADRQDYEVELATLAERARIAREIHDNVGHQLTRASLQTEALRVVHANEPRIAADFADVKRTVDEALQLVRASVHALNDNAVDLSVQLERIVEGARSDSGPQVELEVLAEHAPANVANCFAAVLREALSNTMRHAHAKTITVRCMEHPSFYQLIVTDDGAGGVQASGCGAAEDMGLSSMRERVEALGGTFTAGPRAGVGGWRVFATVPKQQGDEGR